MKINRKHLPVFFYSGVFLIAYSGFFYQEYDARQQKNTLAAFGPTTEAVIASELQSRHHDAISATDNRQTADEEGPSAASATNENFKSRNSAPASPNGIDSASSTFDNVTPEFINTGVQPGGGPEEAKPPTGAPASDAVSLVASASRTSAFAAVDPASSTTSRRLASRPFDRPAVDETSDTTPAPADAGSNGTTEVDDSITRLTASDDASNATETVQPAASPQERWAVPGCPLELATGADEMVAQQMMESYGCRYLHYCRAVNDGSGDQYCWWGFYSTS